MKASTTSILITIILAIMVAISDYFLKNASASPSPILNRNFLFGLILTVAVTFGWIIVMPHLKLAYIGVIHSLTVILSLCVVGVVFFDETLKPSEWLGVGLAISSLLLLYRVA